MSKPTPEELAQALDRIDTSYRTFIDTLQDAMVWVGSFPSYGWVPVRQRRPSESMGAVLVYLPDGDTFYRIGRFDYSATWSKFGVSKEWFIKNLPIPDEDLGYLHNLRWSFPTIEGPFHVTHWLPLVPPPKDEVPK